MASVPPSELKLPKTHEEALTAAAVILIDELLMDIDHARFMEDKWNPADSMVLDRLPRGFKHRYSSGFLQGFLFIVSTVAWKLAQQNIYQLSCVAEELALDIIVREASALLDTYGIDADFEDFMELAYEDHDFMLLYDSSLDGFEDTPAAAWAGMEHLKFDEWFLEFGDGSLGQVHPYVVDGDPPSWMRDD